MKTIFNKNLILICLTICFTNLIFSQKSTIYLWDGSPPNSIVDNSYKEEINFHPDGTVKSIGQISNPRIEVFRPTLKSNGIGILIFPGGGYKYVAIKKEGYNVAKKLNEMGYTAFVVTYRMPSDRIMKNKMIGPLIDAQEAMRFLRINAKEYNIMPDRLGVLGFSAGGHLVASLHTKYNDSLYASKYKVSARPDFSVLIYPVISMKDKITHKQSKLLLLGDKSTSLIEDNFSNELNINYDLSPAFIVHASDDSSVSVHNSLRYYESLIEKSVPVAMHIYQSGGHGFGLGVNTENERWTGDLDVWIRNHFF